MILPRLPLPIRMCCSAAYAIKDCRGKGMKRSECLKKVGISILKEIFVIY